MKKESVGGPTCSGLIKSRPGLAWPNPVTLSHRSHGRSTQAPVLWTHTDGGEPMRKFPKACNPKHKHKCTTTAQQRIDANAAVRCPAGVPVQHTMRIPPYAIGSPGHFASVDRTRTFRHPNAMGHPRGKRALTVLSKQTPHTMQAHRAFGRSVLWQPVCSSRPAWTLRLRRPNTDV